VDGAAVGCRSCSRWDSGRSDESAEVGEDAGATAVMPLPPYIVALVRYNVPAAPLPTA
jgi:hypothetical protein